MYLYIEEPCSGHVITHRSIAPNEILDLKTLVNREFLKIYGESDFVEVSNYPCIGSAHYYACIRDTKDLESVVVWSHADFFRKE